MGESGSAAVLLAAGDAEGIAEDALPEKDDAVGDDDTDHAALSSAVPSSQPARMGRVCWRLSSVAVRGRWIMAGPVHDLDDVDPLAFTTAVAVEGLPKLSSREVYARAVPLLVTKHMYRSTAAAHASVEHVRTEYDSSSATFEEPCWQVDKSNGLPFRRILDEAIACMKQGRVKDGLIKFISLEPLASHPWRAYKLRLLGKRGERRGAVSYRRACRGRRTRVSAACCERRTAPRCLLSG